MTQTNTATEAQLSTIRARAVNGEARAMMTAGVTLTHEQADDLGQDAIGWMSQRLGLAVRETASGVECLPPAAVVSDGQIEALRGEAGAAGDLEQVALCDRALAGDTAARAACVDVIAEAAARS